MPDTKVYYNATDVPPTLDDLAKHALIGVYQLVAGKGMVDNQKRIVERAYETAALMLIEREKYAPPEPIPPETPGDDSEVVEP